MEVKTMREIYKVVASQVVASEAHPEGVYSTVSGYPKTFDSRNYNATAENPDGDAEKALRVAKADYHAQQSAFEASDARAMWTLTLERTDGRQIMRDSWGGFPDMTPQPGPEAEPEEPVETEGE
jgi:hypothetical protein